MKPFVPQNTVRFFNPDDPERDLDARDGEGANGVSANDSTPTLSIVAPVYNEEANLREFYAQVSAELERMRVDWEMIFVDDGSADSSREILRELRRKDARVRFVGFSRNFGNQAAISAGLFASRGAATLVMDADLQQPPATIPTMFQYWRDGYRVVEGVRRDYGDNAGWFKKASSKAFYRIMNALSDVELEPNASEYRLYDRAVLEALRRMPERARFLRAMTRWLGFKRIAVPFDVAPRFAGTSSFSTGKLLRLALDGVFGFSIKPLRWIAYLGLLTFLAVLPYGGWALFQFCFLGVKTPGWTSLLLLNMLLGGGILISLGVVGEYVGRIYEEVKRRPLYVVEEKRGFANGDDEERDAGKPGRAPSTTFDSTLAVDDFANVSTVCVASADSPTLTIATVASLESRNDDASDAENDSRRGVA